MKASKKPPVRIFCKCWAWKAGTASMAEAMAAHAEHNDRQHTGNRRSCYVEDERRGQ